MKIGILVDMDIGQLLADWIDPTILAIEDAMNEGVYDRPGRDHHRRARGLPRENYLKVRKGYQKLVDEGCVVVLGPMISDNSGEPPRPRQRDRRAACIGWTGARRFAGDYCFTVANGDIPTEVAMCANWCFQKGYEKVGFFWEKGSSGTRLRRLLPRRSAAASASRSSRRSLGPNPRDMERAPRPRCATRGAEAIVYEGYGYSTFHFAAAFKALDWDPPRIMGTAFMFYSNSNEWAEGLEGWHGVDQLGEDGTNPNYEAMLERFEERFGRMSRNVVVALAYDTARAGIHGIANAAIATPEEVKDGLEKIKWMPCTNGGPAHLRPFAPYDHRGYKGDFLTIRELRDGELRFGGYYRPEWPSNRSSPLLVVAAANRPPCAGVQLTQNGGSGQAGGDGAALGGRPERAPACAGAGLLRAPAPRRGPVLTRSSRTSTAAPSGRSIPPWSASSFIVSRWAGVSFIASTLRPNAWPNTLPPSLARSQLT